MEVTLKVISFEYKKTFLASFWFYFEEPIPAPDPFVLLMKRKYRV